MSQNVPAPSSDYSVVLHAFEKFSQPLLIWPKTLINSNWVDRPELTSLLDTIRDTATSASFIVGKPGTGKSALLSRLCESLAEQGIACLGIKADTLPVEIDSLGKLAQLVLGSGGNIADTLRQVGLTRKVVVIFDQLDALASLVDLQSGRLNVLLDLIAGIRGSNGVHIVASVREFDLKYDNRLNSLLAADSESNERFELSGFSREKVLELLSVELNIDAVKWPEEHLKFLETPYNLSQFMEHFSALVGGNQAIPHASFFESIQRAHHCTYDVTVASSKNRKTLDDVIAKVVAKIEETESFWHSDNIFRWNEAQLQAIEELIGLGWLFRQIDERVGFRHQTQYEYLLGRRFVDEPQNFVRYVFDRSDGLFVRPTVWHTLALMRYENQVHYEQAMGQLLARIDQRHLRRLFMEFLAEADEPTDAELSWVESLLESTNQSDRMCWLLRGKRAWFAKLSDSVFEKLMRRPSDRTWTVCRVLEASWKLGSERTKSLLQQHWAYDRDYAEQVWVVLSRAPKIDKEMHSWMMHSIANKSNEEVRYLPDAISSLAKDQPEWAFQVISLILNLRLEKAERDNSADSEVDALGRTLESKGAKRQRNAVEKEFRQNQWYGVEKVAMLSPREFLQTLWPWFVQAMKLSNDGHRSRQLTFKREHSSYQWFREPPWSGAHLILAIEQSLIAFAKDDPTGFLKFLCLHGRIDSLVAQRLFARALIQIANVAPKAVLTFFRDDSRRFLLSDIHGVDETMELFRAVVPFLSRSQLEDLQHLVLCWQGYRDDGEPELMQSYRAARLRCIPVHQRTEEAVQLIGLESQLPHSDSNRMESLKRSALQRISSPLPAATLTEMDNVELIRTVREALINYRQQSEKTNGWAIQDLIREFTSSLEASPSRASEIGWKLDSVDDGLFAGAIVRNLVKSKHDSSELFDLIRHFANVKFIDLEFQDEVGWALSELAIPERGLPDDILLTLIAWMVTYPVEKPQHEFDEDKNGAIEDSENLTSVLWSYRPSLMYPNRWFPIGEAIKLGFCCRKEPDSKTWLDVFLSLTDVRYSAVVWRAWVFELINRSPDARYVGKLLDALILDRPDVMVSDIGIKAVAEFGDVIDVDTRGEFLRSLAESKLVQLQLGAGELATILHVRDKDEVADALIKTELLTGNHDAPTPFRVGMAFAAAHCWPSRDFKEASFAILKSLLPSASEQINHAILSVFDDRQKLTDDKATRDLLELFADHLSFRRVRDLNSVILALKFYVRLNSELTLRVMRKIVDGLQALARESPIYGMGFIEGDFLDIILTIHRKSKTKEMREKSLTLYEDLMDLEIHGAFERLKELDQRPS